MTPPWRSRRSGRGIDEFPWSVGLADVELVASTVNVVPLAVPYFHAVLVVQVVCWFAVPEVDVGEGSVRVDPDERPLLGEVAAAHPECRPGHILNNACCKYFKI